MLVVPTPAAVARPFEPDALLTAAMLLSEEAQVTAAVRSWVVLSVKVPVAVNCSVSPLAMLGFGGVTWIADSVAPVTVRVVSGEVTLPRLALMLAEPTAVADARPLEPGALLMLAMLESDDNQVTAEVRSCLELSLKLIGRPMWLHPVTGPDSCHARRSINVFAEPLTAIVSKPPLSSMVRQ